MQMISGKLKHLFHTLQALKVKVLLKVSFRSTGNVTWLPHTVVFQHLNSPSVSFLSYSPHQEALFWCVGL